MDQGLVATSNFILNILLARWLIPVEYGAFTVSYTLFLFLGTLHAGMINEPMMVFGPGKYKDKVGPYLRILIYGNWIYGFVVGAILLLTYLTVSRSTNNPLAINILVLSIVSPFILFQWLLRRACYINLQLKRAAITGAVYMIFSLCGAFSLYYFKWLNSTTALFVMSIASLISALWLFSKLRLSHNFKKDKELVGDVINDHWLYGRWASGTSVLTWIPGNIFTIFLPIWWGIEAAAAYKAIINMLLPIMHLTTALGGIFLPVLVERRGLTNFRHLVLLFSIFIIFLTVIYWILLGIYSEFIIRFFYNGKYVEFADLVWIAGIIPIMGGIITVSGCALQAMELPNKVFFAYAVSSGVTLTVGVLLVLSLGLNGAMASTLLSYIVTGIIMIGILGFYQKPSKLKIYKNKKVAL